MTRPEPGSPAPDFEVALPGSTITLESFAGRPLVMVFLRHLA